MSDDVSRRSGGRQEAELGSAVTRASGYKRDQIDIIGKKLLSLKPVVRSRRSYKIAGLIKRQKSFQGLAMYGHEVFDVLTKASKVIQDTFRVKWLFKVVVFLFENHKAAGLLFPRLTMNSG
jgi:hypothetical protein